MVTSLIGGGVFLVFGALGIAVGVSELRKWRHIKSTEPISIRDAAVADGIVETKGTVQTADNSPLKSPMTERDCVAFEYDLKRLKGSDRKNVDHGSQHQPFVIDDGTATAYVDPADGELSLGLDPIENITLHELPDYIHTNPPLQGTRVYKEGRIEVGDDAYVLGSTTECAHADADTQFNADDGILLISNQDAAGTAKRLFRRGVFLSPIGLVSFLVGAFILSSELLI